MPIFCNGRLRISGRFETATSQPIAASRAIHHYPSLSDGCRFNFEKEDYVDVVMRETDGQGVKVFFDTIGGAPLTCSPDTLAQLGRVVLIVELAKPQDLIQAWGKNASCHFVFTRQSRGKLDELKAPGWTSFGLLCFEKARDILI